jgi:hypothetical protein
MGTNEIKQANGIALEKDYMFFCQSFFFHMNEFLNFFSQIVMKNAYYCLDK